MPIIKPFAFVLMPFSKEFDDIYHLGIKNSCENAGFIAERVDEQSYSETILERIYRQINVADVVIADMTGKNPNVFYEVGFAHAKSKRCTLLTQNSSDIPFDLKHHRHIVYEGSIQILQDKLSNELEWHKQEFAINNTKLLSVSLSNMRGTLTKSAWSAKGEVDIDIDIQNISGQKIREIEAIYLHTGGGWAFRQGSEKCLTGESELGDYTRKHFIRSPMPTLSPNAWAPISILGTKQLAFKTKGENLKDSYHLSGHVTLEIITGSGNFRERLDLDILVEEFPF